MKKFYIVLFVIILGFGGLVYLNYKKTAPLNLPKLYKNETYKFSINLPDNFTVDEGYKYQANPTNVISGVRFNIPKSLSDGTNLSSDTYISVESLPGAINSCSAEAYLDSPVSAGFVDSNGHRYSVAKSSGAGAGNRYDETVFATSVDGGCLAVRYFIHSSVYENYPEGSIQRFDPVALTATFDSIKETLKI